MMNDLNEKHEKMNWGDKPQELDMLCENTDHIKNAQGISSGFIKADCLESHRLKMQIIFTVTFCCHVSLPNGGRSESPNRPKHPQTLH